MSTYISNTYIYNCVINGSIFSGSKLTYPHTKSFNETTIYIFIHPSSYQFTFLDNQSITQSISQPLNHTVSQPVSSSVNQSMTYDLQIGVQRVWRRAVSSPRIRVWHFPSQSCSEASDPTASNRSCTVFFKTFKFRPPNTVQRQNAPCSSRHSSSGLQTLCKDKMWY